MSIGVLGVFSPDTDPAAILSFLDHSMFDELFEIDLNQNFFRLIYHIEEKYFMPVTEGDYEQFCQYAAKHGVHPDERDFYQSMMDREHLTRELEAGSPHGTASLRCRLRGIDRHWRWVEHILIGGEEYGLAPGIVRCYVFDIQPIVDREEGTRPDYSRRQILPDTLTGLYRTRDFFDLAQSIRYEPRKDWILLVLDLEKFKLFNDWYGREKGDLVLASVGAILFDTAERTGGLAGYLSNDDFCLMGPESEIEVESLFEAVHGAVRRYGVSAGFMPAFGISRIQEDVPMMDIVDMASLACETAKKDYRSRICYFDSDLVKTKEKEYLLLSEFQDALVQKRIQVYLQPQCRASNGKIVGAEALTRWFREDHSAVSPGYFVPILERYGFVTDLDQYIWEQVCIWQRSWIDAGHTPLPVSVNVSQVDIFTIDVPEHFCTLMDRYQLNRRLVEIEITESAVGDDLSKVRTVVQQLRAAGFSVLMDDFGNGYASLNMLHEMDMDVIKLDARFLMNDRALESRGIHILESVVSMAKTMGLPVIVEGVEKQEECEFLMHLGCRYIQGYYFYRPMKMEEYERLISDPEKVDLGGIRFKENEEFHLREFLDESVYSDSMLNSILGAVALYSWEGEDINIIRFNEQFYEVVNDSAFQDRLTGIQDYMPEEDRKRFYMILEHAMDDRLNGASGVLNFYKTDGRTFRFLIHFYYLGEDGKNRRFYGSVRNITEFTKLQRQMELIARFFSDTLIFVRGVEGRYSYQVAAHGLSEETGLSWDDLEEELNKGIFYDRVIPEYRDMLKGYSWDAIIGIDFSTIFAITNARGERVNLFIRSEYIDDPASGVRSLLIISRRQNLS